MPYVETCDDETREKVYATFFELQAFVNTTCVEVCSSSPCQNDGVCTDNSDSYNCSCVAGYAGPNCEEGGRLFRSIFSNFHSLSSVVQVTSGIARLKFKRRQQLHRPYHFSTLTFFYKFSHKLF